MEGGKRNIRNIQYIHDRRKKLFISNKNKKNKIETNRIERRLIIWNPISKKKKKKIILPQLKTYQKKKREKKEEETKKKKTRGE